MNKTGPLDDNSSTLDLSNLSNGMYFLSVEVNDTTLTRKLIKK
ncbi:T9SS type A sorting domain-containing protein [Nonlabens tegetincola]